MNVHCNWISEESDNMSCTVINVSPPYPTAISRADIFAITGHAKSHLFLHAGVVSQTERAKAVDILTRMQHLLPSLAKSFKPTEDSMDDIPFRLLFHSLRPSACPPSYIALSYCWKESDAITKASASGVLVSGRHVCMQSGTKQVTSASLFHHHHCCSRRC